MWYQIKSYWQYLKKAKGATYLHSPFVYELYTQEIKPKKKYYAFYQIENLRKKYKKNHQKIQITDLGAGSKISKNNLRTLSSLAKISASSKKEAQLLFKLVNKFKARQGILPN
jgi:hypothetical protein